MDACPGDARYKYQARHRIWHNLAGLEIPRYPTSFRCESFALEEVAIDADPGATAKRLSSSQGQMWVDLGGQTSSCNGRSMWIEKTRGRGLKAGEPCSKSTAGLMLIGFQNRTYKPKT